MVAKESIMDDNVVLRKSVMFEKAVERENMIQNNVALNNKSIRTTMRLKWQFWDILGQFRRLYGEFGAIQKTL